MLSIDSRIAISIRRSPKFIRAEDKTGYPLDGVPKQAWLLTRETLTFTWKTEDRVSIGPIYISLSYPERVQSSEAGQAGVERDTHMRSECHDLARWALSTRVILARVRERNELLFTQTHAEIFHKLHVREYSPKTHNLYFWFSRKMALNGFVGIENLRH